MMSVVQTDKAPAAIGPYSQAVRAGNLMFVSGQIPLDPATGQIVGTDIETQTDRVMKNLLGILASQNLAPDRIAKTTVYLSDMGLFARFNEVYGKFLKAPYPARATIQVARLPKDVMVEVEAIVVCG